jgi:hypothetical protein
MSEIGTTPNLSYLSKDRPPGVGQKFWQFAFVYPTMAILMITDYSDMAARASQVINWATLSTLFQSNSDVENYKIWARNPGCINPPPPAGAWQTTILSNRHVHITLCPETADIWIRIEEANASEPRNGISGDYLWIGAEKYLKSPPGSGSTPPGH